MRKKILDYSSVVAFDILIKFAFYMNFGLLCFILTLYPTDLLG